MPHRLMAMLLLLPASFLSADTGTGQFIQQRAFDPIKLQVGLPEAASRLHTKHELQLSVVHNNVFMGGRIGDERLILDGESSQLNLRYRRQLNPCWQLNIGTVWLAHSRGWFDNPVDDWHQVFGLPDAQRGEWPANQLEYTYENGGRLQSVRNNTQGRGDAQLQVQRSLGCTKTAPILRAGFKLPIGDVDQLRGNGVVDAFIDVQSPWKKTQPSSRWHWAGSIGVLRAGKHQLLAEQEPIIGFGVFGVNVSLNSRWQLLGQIDWHTPMFKSELRELGNTSAQLTLGLRYATRSGSAWEISFSEDAVVDTSPDIVVRLAWVARFGESIRARVLK